MTADLNDTRSQALLTVDLEDYRWLALREHSMGQGASNASEVMRQLEAMLALFEESRARATFFAVGNLATQIHETMWRLLTTRHIVGCHGYEHKRVDKLGREGFRADLRHAQQALQDATGVPITSFRAPYFSADGCESWFGQILGEEGFRLDSSFRIRHAPQGFNGTMPLVGSGGAVWEVPLPSIGVGAKRLTIIGGTYMRLLPTRMILDLLVRAKASGFVPMVYLHPYDLDARAPPLLDNVLSNWRVLAGDLLRRAFRASLADKFRTLAKHYRFISIEEFVAPMRVQ